MPKKRVALVITCGDNRTHPIVGRWIVSNDGSYDLITFPGAGIVCSHTLASPLGEMTREHLFTQVALYIALHNVQEVLIFAHQDCGAMAGAGLIPHDLPIAEDKALHQRYLPEVITALNEQFHLPVRAFYVALSGEIFAM